MPRTKPQTPVTFASAAPADWRLAACPVQARSQDGFALIVVIWAIGLIALLFVTYVAAARYRSIAASGLAERARAESAATAAINIAILDLLTTASDEASASVRFRRDASPALCTLPSGLQVAIAITDEGGKIDLNSADPALITALVRGLRRNNGPDEQLTTEILRLREAAAAAQRARGVASPNTLAFRTAFELDQVPGMDSDLFRAMMPLTTVHSGRAGFDPRVAPAALLKTLLPSGSASRSEARTQLSSSFIADSPGRAFLISSEAVTRTGVRFSRDALVELSPGAAYRIREWREGSLQVINGARSSLPAC
jgi:type II secretory pathway component PulK